VLTDRIGVDSPAASTGVPEEPDFKQPAEEHSSLGALGELDPWSGPEPTATPAPRRPRKRSRRRRHGRCQAR
jgi:hypothetical protein